MSYILDALRKAEEKEEEAGVPALLSIPSHEARGLKRRALWPYPLTFALLVNAAAIFWSLYPRTPGEPLMPGENRTLVQAPVTHLQGPEAAHLTTPGLTPAGEEEDRSLYLSSDISPHDQDGGGRERTGENRQRYKPQPKQEQGSHALRSIDPQNRAQREASNKSPVLAGREAPRMLSSSPSGTGRPDDAAAEIQAQPHQRAVRAAPGEIFSLDQLPLSVRSNLPAFHLSGHAYGPEPASRVVRINEQVLQEGELLGPGLRVEEITPGGVVLSYRAYRFQVGLNSK